MTQPASQPHFNIAVLPGDGIGVDVLEAAKIVLNKLRLDAEYIGRKFDRAACFFTINVINREFHCLLT